MVSIALSPIDAVGHLTRMLAVSRALVEHPRVSRVRGFGHARLAPLFRQTGADFDVTEFDDEEAGSGDLAWKSFVRPLRHAESAMERMVDFAPDVVLYDAFSNRGVLGAHLCGVPSVSLVTMAGYGTLSDDFVRQYPWDRPDILAANSSYAEKFQFDFRAEGMMPSLFPSRDLSLVAAAKPMTLAINPVTQPLLHEKFHWVNGRTVSVGPCLATGRTTGEVIAAVSPPMAGADHDNFPFEALEQAKCRGRRIIVFSLGTVITDFRYRTPVGGASSGQAFLRRSLEIMADAVRNNPDLLLVAAVGSRFPPESDIDWPENAIVRAVLPQRQLLQDFADAFVTHHGAGSQAESILSGVPMISLPGVGDQIPNAHLAGRLQAAVAYWDLSNPYSSCNAELMRSAIEFALNDPRPRRACAALAAEMRRENGVELAADIIVSLAEKRRSRTIAGLAGHEGGSHARH